jgi:hypothetical protein
VVGVLDDAATHPTQVDVWLPLQFKPTEYENRFFLGLSGIGRLTAGMSLAEAEQRLRAGRVRRC